MGFGSLEDLRRCGCSVSAQRDGRRSTCFKQDRRKPQRHSDRPSTVEWLFRGRRPRRRTGIVAAICVRVPDVRACGVHGSEPGRPDPRESDLRLAGE